MTGVQTCALPILGSGVVGSGKDYARRAGIAVAPFTDVVAWAFVTLVLTALALGAPLAHALEMPVRRTYAPALYVEVTHTLYFYFGTGEPGVRHLDAGGGTRRLDAVPRPVGVHPYRPRRAFPARVLRAAGLGVPVPFRGRAHRGTAGDARAGGRLGALREAAKVPGKSFRPVCRPTSRGFAFV